MLCNVEGFCNLTTQVTIMKWMLPSDCDVFTGVKQESAINVNQGAVNVRFTVQSAHSSYIYNYL